MTLSSRREVVTLLPPTDDDATRLSLLLGDGASWSAQSLADHAGISKRTAQRALAKLVADRVATRTGTGRVVRYTRPAPPIASRMLLLGLMPDGAVEETLRVPVDTISGMEATRDGVFWCGGRKGALRVVRQSRLVLSSYFKT